MHMLITHIIEMTVLSSFTIGNSLQSRNNLNAIAIFIRKPLPVQ